MSILVGEFPVSMHVRALYLRIGLLLALSHILVFESKAQQPDVPFDLSSSSLAPRDQGTDARERVVSLVSKNESVGTILKDLARQANINITYSRKIVPVDKRIESFEVKEMPISQALNKVLEGTDLIAVVNANGHAVVAKKEPVKSFDQDTTQMARGSIKGKVIDSVSLTGLERVVISIASLNITTKTDSKGFYKITGVPYGEHSITFRVLGYSSVKRAVRIDANSPVSLDVRLSASASTLNEVVTTAIGTQRRVDISNDVVKIDADRLMQSAPIRSVTDMLIAAQVQGMQITRTSGDPGAPSRLRIGGLGSISQSNDPVVIVDGVWIKSAFSTSGIARQIPISGSNGQLLQSRLDEIDPATIESIEIVRGPAAATLYGPDAANGVIRITTKRGSVGPARWDLQFSRDWGEPKGKHAQTYEGFGRGPFSDQPVSCNVNQVLNETCTQDSVRSYSLNHPLLMREGVSVLNNVSATVSGGTSQIRYSLSAGFRDQLGARRMSGIDVARARVISLDLPSQLERPSVLRSRSLSSRITMSPRDNLDISLNFEGSQGNSKEANLVLPSPLLDIFDTLAVFYRQINSNIQRSSASKTSGLVGLNTQWRPTNEIQTSLIFGLDREITKELLYYRGNVCKNGTCAAGGNDESNAGRTGSIYTMRANSTFSPNLGMFSKFITFRPGLSFDLRRQTSSSNQIRINRNTQGGSVTADFQEGPTTALGGISLNAFIRVFDRISIDPAIRKDFGGNETIKNNSKTYPRFGTSWLISEEGFFPKQDLISNMRLRVAFGFAAVQPRLNQLYGRYGSGTRVVNGVSTVIVSPLAPGNPNLEPERSSEIEMGFDTDLLNERLSMSLTYSFKQNRNSIIDRQVAPSIGLSQTRQENIAKVVNHSTNVNVNSSIIDNSSVRLRVVSGFSFLNNKIAELGNGVSPLGTFEARYIAGYPVGGLWASQLLGIYDLDGDGEIRFNEIVFSDSMSYMGSSQPAFSMNHQVELGLSKHVTVNAFIDYKGKFVQNRATVWNSGRGYWDINASEEEKLLSSILTRITSGGNRDFQGIQELRLTSASVTVNLPNQIGRYLRAQGVQLSFQGKNLGLWTKYRGRDPGINSSPIGDRTTDDGQAIGIPREFALQFRLRY